MTQLKAGGRLRSAVCTTEVMVILAPHDGVDLSCGGAAMLALGTEPPAGLEISPDAKDGTQIGKRYVNEAGDLELLCTKPGEGSLAAAGEPLSVKGAKPLPSSD
jgi:hypothetical protein